ncbi:MAG TPA: RNB domain-containing ribonuclease [Candidatus Thermoplasmatota archaeon]|nr:RNB domain-containing ribonuclease [Candidatus Thermoplasmatota archaeon]
MKRGDLVEFKADLFGIKAGENFGIYLDRERQGKAWFAILWTMKGRREVKTDHVKGVRVASRGELADDELDSRLRALVAEVGKQPERAKEVRPDDVTDRDLWRFASQAGEDPLTLEQIGAAFFRTPTPRRQDVELVRNVLVSCARPGVGYFERAPGREERWKALPPLDYRRVKQEIEGMNGLRKKLVRAEDLEEENPDDPKGPPVLRTVFRGVPIAEAGLTEEDRARLDVVARLMQSFVLHDRDTGEVGLGGTPVHTIDGFRLFDLARWLAVDWTGSTRVSVSSAFVEFLVDSGLWTVEGALRTVARRKVLGHRDFSWELDANAVRESERVPAEIRVEGRTDLRAQPTWTIDPADAKDHDDAVAYERLPDGRHVLWVHIADVSAYVEKDGALDRDARRRATSVYLPLGVLPMLPPRLSNALCSLNEDVDRYALTAKITYDAEGVIVGEEFLESVIRVSGNVSYDEADAAIREAREPFASMEAFARVVGARRRGLALDTGERRVRVGSEGVTHAIKVGTPATRMIEVFMVAANEAVARKLTAEGLALLYRCHPLPDTVGVERFNAQAKVMGLDLEIDLPERSAPEPERGMTLLDQLKAGGKVSLGGLGHGLGDDEPATAEAAPAAAPTVRGLAQLSSEEQEKWLAPFRAALASMDRVEDPRFRELVQVKMLGAMGRAIYTPRNLGHFGLGSTCYCHFTSPIRRYPDLVVHRQLRWLLRGRQGDPPHGADLEDLAIHCSEQGSAAEGLERGVVNAALVFASREAQWSGPVSALVNGITKGGVFLSLEGGLEARLAAADIPGGPWSVDDDESMLFQGSLDRPGIERELDVREWRKWTDERTGEARRVRYKLADQTLVTLAGRDYVDGRIAAKLAGTPG